MKRWSLKCGGLVLSHETTLREDDKNSDSPWGAIAVFLALGSLILQAVSMAL